MKTYKKKNKLSPSTAILWLILACSILGVMVISGLFFQGSIYPKVRTYMERSSHEQYIVTLVNRERAKHGIAPVSENILLDDSAKAKGEDMIKNNYYAHVSPQGVQYYEFPKRQGYQWAAFGEDLAINFTNDNRLFTAWMNSPKHREVILDPAYNEAGFAHVGKYAILHMGER